MKTLIRSAAAGLVAIMTMTGAALADTLGAYVRVHLTCVRLCGMRLPTAYARQLSRRMYDELQHAFKRPSALLHAADTSEETWRAVPLERDSNCRLGCHLRL